MRHWRKSRRHHRQQDVTPSQVILVLVFPIEGFPASRTPQTMSGRQMSLAVSDHGLWEGECLSAQGTNGISPEEKPCNTSWWHPLLE